MSRDLEQLEQERQQNNGKDTDEIGDIGEGLFLIVSRQFIVVFTRENEGWSEIARNPSTYTYAIS